MRVCVQPFIVGGDSPGVVQVAARVGDKPRDHFAVPEHVVGDEQPARTEERDKPIQHRRVLSLVAILKDQIERSRDLCQHPLRIADDDARAVREAGAREVFAGYRRSRRIDLE